MTRHGLAARALAVSLSTVAGYVDAVGFLAMGGFFVSFMSGNTTRLSVAVSAGSPQGLIAGGLIGAFVLGVIAGSLVGRAFKRHRRCAVLAMVSLLLALTAALAKLGAPSAVLGLVAMAMGAENATFEREGEPAIGLTYMTGALVTFAQRLTSALLGGPRWAWAPYLLLWAGLTAGAVTGAVVYSHLRLDALWVAAILTALLAGVASKITN